MGRTAALGWQCRSCAHEVGAAPHLFSNSGKCASAAHQGPNGAPLEPSLSHLLLPNSCVASAQPCPALWGSPAHTPPPPLFTHPPACPRPAALWAAPVPPAPRGPCPASASCRVSRPCGAAARGGKCSPPGQRSDGAASAPAPPPRAPQSAAGEQMAEPHDPKPQTLRVAADKGLAGPMCVVGDAGQALAATG